MDTNELDKVWKAFKTKKEAHEEAARALEVFKAQGGEVVRLYSSTRGRTNPTPRVRWTKIAKIAKGARDYHPTA